MEKSKGLTETERYLVKLCEASFLSLWSYPNLYKGEGDELCDVLVVFGEHVIIFSDKSCQFSEGDVITAWNRWYRKSIRDSAKQIYGAERWIKNFPDQIFMDAQSQQKFPFHIPLAEKMKVHRVVVASNIADHVENHFDSVSGSLMFNSAIVGDEHILSPDDPLLGFTKTPFCVGQISPQKGFVHIFDDNSLKIVLQELDTISDFVKYLSDKEKLIEDKLKVIYYGEEELLAYYIKSLDDKDSRSFTHNLPENEQPSWIIVPEGHWEQLKIHPQFFARKDEDKVSYFWDDLIEKFNRHYFRNELPIFSGNESYEIGMRVLASENRLSRRLLSLSYIDLGRKLMERQPARYAARGMLSLENEKLCYIFLNYFEENSDQSEHRKIRETMLKMYCYMAAINWPKFEAILGIASEPCFSRYASYDLCYIVTKDIEPEFIKELKEQQERHGIFKPENLEMTEICVQEFPEIDQ